MQDAVLRDQRMADRMADRDAAAAAVLAERDAALAAKLEGLVKAVSESVDTKIKNLSASVDGKLDNLEKRVQEQWETFENKWTEKLVHPDDQEAAITQAEFRIRVTVQKGVEERRKTRMENEDKITTNAIEVLRSDLNKMSAKMAEEVVCEKRQASGQRSQYGIWVYGKWWQEWVTFHPDRCKTLSLLPESNSKDGGCWRNSLGTGITLDEAKQDDLNMFDWDMTDRDRGIFLTRR